MTQLTLVYKDVHSIQETTYKVLEKKNNSTIVFILSRLTRPFWNDVTKPNWFVILIWYTEVYWKPKLKAEKHFLFWK